MHKEIRHVHVCKSPVYEKLTINIKNKHHIGVASREATPTHGQGRDTQMHRGPAGAHKAHKSRAAPRAAGPPTEPTRKTSKWTSTLLNHLPSMQWQRGMTPRENYPPQNADLIRHPPATPKSERRGNGAMIVFKCGRG